MYKQWKVGIFMLHFLKYSLQSSARNVHFKKPAPASWPRDDISKVKTYPAKISAGQMESLSAFSVFPVHAGEKYLSASKCFLNTKWATVAYILVLY